MPTEPSVRDFERVIIGIDPGTNVMGYGILGVNGRNRSRSKYGVKHQKEEKK